MNALTTHTPLIARVVGVATTTITVAAVTDVVGVASAFLPAATLDVTDLKVLKTDLASISDSSLYTPLAKRNVSNVDISEATLVIRRTFSVDIASNQLSAQVTAAANETFLQFDEERYLLTRSETKESIVHRLLKWPWPHQNAYGSSSCPFADHHYRLPEDHHGSGNTYAAFQRLRRRSVHRR